MSEYPWYTIVAGNDALEQGDFLDECPIIVPPSQIVAGQRTMVDVLQYDVIVMTQSCDLSNRKIDLVLVCPVWSLTALAEKYEMLRKPNGKERLRQGHVAGYHLVNKCEVEGFATDYLVVDFRNVYSVPYAFICDFAMAKPNRRRLLPPYREHLSQAFARFFMRVGLPVDIPQFK